MERCVFCDQNLNDGQPTITLTAKGSNGVNGPSKIRGSSIRTEVDQSVHQECQRLFTDQKNVASTKNQLQDRHTPHVLRSTSQQFNFNEHCLFCGSLQSSMTGKEPNDAFPDDFKASVSEVCGTRNDDRAKLVVGMIAYAEDLHAKNAVYHQACSVKFRTGKQVPKQYSSADGVSFKTAKHGRHEEQDGN